MFSRPHGWGVKGRRISEDDGKGNIEVELFYSIVVSFASHRTHALATCFTPAYPNSKIVVTVLYFDPHVFNSTANAATEGRKFACRVFMTVHRHERCGKY